MAISFDPGRLRQSSAQITPLIAGGATLAEVCAAAGLDAGAGGDAALGRRGAPPVVTHIDG